jgi:hypothetical protein
MELGFSMQVSDALALAAAAIVEGGIARSNED